MVEMLSFLPTLLPFLVTLSPFAVPVLLFTAVMMTFLNAGQRALRSHAAMAARLLQGRHAQVRRGLRPNWKTRVYLAKCGTEAGTAVQNAVPNREWFYDVRY